MQAQGWQPLGIRGASVRMEYSIGGGRFRRDRPDASMHPTGDHAHSRWPRIENPNREDGRSGLEAVPIMTGVSHFTYVIQFTDPVPNLPPSRIKTAIWTNWVCLLDSNPARYEQP